MKTLGVFALGCMILMGACGAEKHLSTPPELLGVWASDDSRYIGRSIEFRPQVVVFNSGTESKEHTVIRYERWEGNQCMEYRITFRDEDRIEALNFQHNADKSIQFKNQWASWKKLGPPTAAAQTTH